MQLSTHRLIVSLIVVATAVTAEASHRPTAGKLLPLVPGNPQVVSGAADPGKGSTAGRLLAATGDNDRDFHDFLALTGLSASVDTDIRLREMIVVASSSSPGKLSDHLLLAEGRFDSRKIFSAALASGAQTIQYSNRQLLAIPAVVLDGNRESEVRWFAILKDSIAVLGSPALVTAAIDRWQQHQLSNPALLNRLAQLQDDADSWSVISMPAPLLAEHLPMLPGRLVSTPAFRNADEVELGVHYGHPARMDFSIHYTAGAPSLSVKSIPAAFALRDSADPNRVHGSVTVSGQKLDAWLAGWAGLRQQKNHPN